MLPTLRPGDCLVVRYGARVRPGDVVVASFAAHPGRLMVKRAVRPAEGGWVVHGDNADRTDDSRTYGPARVEARVLFRYWPLSRRR